jgi:hypothetical protein
VKEALVRTLLSAVKRQHRDGGTARSTERQVGSGGNSGTGAAADDDGSACRGRADGLACSWLNPTEVCLSECDDLSLLQMAMDQSSAGDTTGGAPVTLDEVLAAFASPRVLALAKQALIANRPLPLPTRT